MLKYLKIEPQTGNELSKIYFQEYKTLQLFYSNLAQIFYPSITIDNLI